MKTKNKIISIFMCLCLALLSGCSQDSGGEPNTGAAGTVNTSAAGNTDKEQSSSTTASGSEAVSEAAAATAPEETEPEDNTPENNLYAYRDLLDEEYEKCGKFYGVSVHEQPLILKDKIIFCENNNNVTTLQVYDITKKQLSKNFNIKFEKDNFGIYFADVDDGFFYVYDGYGEQEFKVQVFYGNITKYDVNGNILGKIELKDEYGGNLQSDDTLFTYSKSDSGHINYMYSSDWKTKTELPSIEIDVGHGLTENVTTYTIGEYYNNKLFVVPYKDYPYDSSYDSNYCINTDTMTYEKVEKSNFTQMTNLTGKYYYVTFKENGEFVATIYDREKDETLDGVRLPLLTTNDLGRLYGIGEFEYDRKEGLYRYRYASDGSGERETREIEIKKDKNAEIYVVNGEYYLYKDEYGYFLRTYEGGEDGEITIMMFEN